MVRTLMISLWLLLPASAGAQQPSSRSMDALNWKEFQQLVPAKVKTVILTVGTLEAHGFINNGADNTVPVAIANAIADACGVRLFELPLSSEKIYWALNGKM